MVSLQVQEKWQRFLLLLQCKKGNEPIYPNILWAKKHGDQKILVAA